MFRPQSAMLTLFGDYVSDKGGEIGIGSLVNLLGNFGLSESATRSAVSRMCRSGVLKAKRTNSRSYYLLTAEGRGLIAEVSGEYTSAHRPTGTETGTSLPTRYPNVCGSPDTLRLELGWLGYGPLSEATWISPYDLTREVENLARKLHIAQYVHIFSARSQGETDPKKIVSRCWDLDKIHKKYQAFLAEYRPKMEQHIKRLRLGENIEPSECFTARFNLIHEYRKLPFFDPNLPLELLPENWLRLQAAALFDEYHNALSDKANEYFDSVSRSYKEARIVRGKI